MSFAAALAAISLTLAASRPAEPTASLQPPSAKRGDIPLVPAKILSQSPRQAVVALDAGRDRGLAVGDRFWALDGPAPVSGEVYMIADAGAAGRVDSDIDLAGRSVVVLRTAALADLREHLAPEIRVQGTISRLPPGRQTAWISIGRRAGLQLRDSVLVRREGLPIARGEVLVVDADAALITLQPLVGNAVPQMGDPAELWPAPGERRLGRVNSAVLAVKDDPEGAVITIPGNVRDGLAEGRLVDVLRGGAYVGVASINETSQHPLSHARMIKSASPELPKEGDAAVVRAPGGPPAPPLRAAIFRVEENYCLIAAGEVDGVQTGERLLVYRSGAPSAAPIEQAVVDKVNVDYSGASIRAAQQRVQLWDIAVRQQPPWPRWEAAGTIELVEPDARLALARIAAGLLRPATVVRLSPQGAKEVFGAIVLGVVGERTALYLPPGWSDAQAAKGAQVEVQVTPEFTASQPTSAPAPAE